MTPKTKKLIQEICISIVCVVLVIALGYGLVASWAKFRLWRADYNGRTMEIQEKYKGIAILARETAARQVRIEAARAERDAATLTAEAIETVGAAAKAYPEYRQQEFFLALSEALKDGNIRQIIYLPTEAGLPITEAVRLTNE